MGGNPGVFGHIAMSFDLRHNVSVASPALVRLTSNCQRALCRSSPSPFIAAGRSWTPPVVMTGGFGGKRSGLVARPAKTDLAQPQSRTQPSGSARPLVIVVLCPEVVIRGDVICLPWVSPASHRLTMSNLARYKFSHRIGDRGKGKRRACAEEVVRDAGGASSHRRYSSGGYSILRHSLIQVSAGCGC